MAQKTTSTYSSNADPRPSKLEIVLKCDVAGTLEAVASSLENLNVPGVDLDIIQAGVGNISKSDVLMAQTGSRLVIGFNVGTMPKLDRHIKEHGIEVRLYDTIYTITADVKKIAQNLQVKPLQDNITGHRVSGLQRIDIEDDHLRGENRPGRFRTDARRRRK